MRKLIEAVALAFGVTYADVVGDSRRQHIVEARQAAAWVLRRATPLSLVCIGELLGGRDHTTMIYSIAQIEERMAADPAFRAELHSLLPQKPPPAPARRRSDHAMRWWVAQARNAFFVPTA